MIDDGNNNTATTDAKLSQSVIRKRRKRRVCLFLVGLAIVTMLFGVRVYFICLCSQADTLIIRVRHPHKEIKLFALNSIETRSFLALVARNTWPHDWSYVATSQNLYVYLVDVRGNCFAVIWVHSTDGTLSRQRFDELIDAASMGKVVEDLGMEERLSPRSVVERVFY